MNYQSFYEHPYIYRIFPNGEKHHVPRWRIGGGALDGEMSGYSTDSLDVDHSGYCVWRVQCSLQVKTSNFDSE